MIQKFNIMCGGFNHRVPTLRLKNTTLYLFSVRVAKDITSHYVDEVWFWVDFTHKATEPLPEPEKRERKNPQICNF